MGLGGVMHHSDVYWAGFSVVGCEVLLVVKCLIYFGCIALRVWAPDLSMNGGCLSCWGFAQ
jgi:hypothetical protein